MILADLLRSEEGVILALMARAPFSARPAAHGNSLENRRMSALGTGSFTLAARLEATRRNQGVFIIGGGTPWSKFPAVSYPKRR